MGASMTALARRELVEALRQRYAAATRDEKMRILSEFALVSGLHRKSAIRVLNAEAEAEPPIKRAGRPRIYDQAVQQALVTLPGSRIPTTATNFRNVPAGPKP